MATSTELQRLAAMANALRPDWPARSVMTYLATDHAAQAYQDLAVALAHIATDPQTQTPKRLSEAGPWWQTTQGAGPTAVPRPSDPRCRRAGHEHELAHNCRICAGDRLAGTDVADPPEITTSQAATNLAGVTLVHATLHPECVLTGRHSHTGQLLDRTGPDPTERG